MHSGLGQVSLAALLFAAVPGCGGGDTGGVGGASSATSSADSSGTGGSGGASGTAGTGGSDTTVSTSTSASTGSSGTGGGAPKGEPFVYVGGYGNQIHIFHLDVGDGSLTPVGSPVDAGTNPSFLAVDPAHHTLFAVNEDGAGKGAVASFHLDAGTGSLSFLSRVSSQGDGPAHVSTDKTGGFAFVANYGGGTVAVLPIGPGGVLGPAIDVHDHGGGSANPHQTIVSPANDFAFVPNKGLNTVTRYAFNAATGKLTSASTLDVAAGAGPRHLDFSPSSPHAYLINENNSTIDALSYDAAAGKLASIQTISTLPSGFQGNNTGAEIQVAPSGKFVYASNRGHDSIAVFSVAPDGKLALVGHQPTMGQVPRHFQIEASGELLLVANQNSSNVVTFRIDAATGTLTPTGKSVTVQSCSYVGVVYLTP
jgi:6-phosphogluconolactonase